MTKKMVMPWEDRPAGCADVMWRYSKNPVIDRYHIPSSNSIFNSAVVPFEDGFAGVFRCDNKAVQMNIFAGFSKDGIHWDIEHEPIKFKAGNTDMIESEYKYDPRVTWIEDRYWITWCNGYYGPTIGVGYTFDFKEFFQCENALLPFNRNGVLFPQKINGKYALLSRPSDSVRRYLYQLQPRHEILGRTSARTLSHTFPRERLAMYQNRCWPYPYPHRRRLAHVLPRCHYHL